MGFFKWIRREFDTPRSSKRRQSEPPLTVPPTFTQDEYPRDEAYIKALSKFNEWRNKQKFGSFSSIRSHRKNSRKSKRNALDIVRKNSLNSNDTSDGNNTVTEKENDTENMKIAGTKSGLKNIYEEIEHIYSEDSLNSSLNYQKSSKNRNRRIKTGSKSLGDYYNVNDKIDDIILTTTTYENEIHNFEKTYCSQGVQTTKNYNSDKIILDNKIQSSPPIKFYKENSNPYNQIKSPKQRDYVEKYSIIYSSMQKQSKNPHNSLRNNKNNSKMEKPKRDRRKRSKTTIIDNDTDINTTMKNSEQFLSKKTYKKFDSNISLPSDCLIETTNKNDSVNDHHYKNKQNQNHCFQTVINKHGDAVEYAIPIMNSKSEENLNDLQNNLVENRQNDLQEYVEDNFRFLENNSSILKEDEPSLSLNNPNNSSRPRKDVIVTDLDQSEEYINTDMHLNDEIMDELKTLELWSQNLNIIPIETTKKSPCSRKKQLNLSGTYFCYMKDLKPRISSFRNSLKCPIIYRSGTFRTTSVSLISCDQIKKDAKMEFALQKNYLILRKLRHPNVAILMAICVNKSNEIVSLITESFDYTLHDVLHKNRIVLPLDDCIDYIFQTISALKYMHECKMVHSNISSHAILLSTHKKLIKLSSFEITTNLDDYEDMKIELTKYENDSRFDPKHLSKDQLPYWIEYRKLFSQHIYQSPELISTKHKFVYPTIKSDIYGVTLSLWEMLNNRIPYELLSYVDIEKFYNSNQTKFPWLKVERCRLFEKIIEQGLNIEPEKRIDDLNLIKLHLEELKNNAVSSISPGYEREGNKTSPKPNKNKQTPTESDSLLEFSKVLKARNFGSELYDRTSTVKKRKEQNVLRNNRLTAKELFQDTNDKNNDGDNENLVRNTENNDKEGNSSKNFQDSGIASNDINTVTTSKTPDIQQDFYLPDTPIARNNKLLKVAWLANNDPLPSDQKSTATRENDNVTVSNTPTKNKTLNVSIRIIHDISPKERSYIDERNSKAVQTEDSLESFISPTSKSSKKDITDHIKYWNSLTSPLCQELSKEIHATENHGHSGTIPKRKNSMYRADERDFVVKTNKSCQSNQQDQQKSQEKLIKRLPSEITNENLEEFFSRPRLNDFDFENTLWRREKEKCEQNNTRSFYEDLSDGGVITPRRTSVRETIHKFENYFKCLYHPVALDFLDETKEAERELSFDANVARMIESREVNETSDADIDIINPTSSELNNIHENIEENVCVESISKLDVVLRSDIDVQNKIFLEKQNEIESSPIEEICKIPNEKDNAIETNTTSLSKNAHISQQQKPLLMALNLKKLRRRASDVGCTTTKNIVTMTPLNKKNKNVRHSICGTEEIFKRLGEVPFINVDQIDKFSTPGKYLIDINVASNRADTKNNVQQEQLGQDVNILSVGQLKCWNCGCQVFAVNGFKESLTEGNPQQSNLNDIQSRQSLGTISQNAKSVEDLYIDDDFDTELGGLCANIELGTDEELQKSDFSDILDFDILSAEILSKLNLNE